MHRDPRPAARPPHHARRLAAILGILILVTPPASEASDAATGKPVLGVLKLQDETGALPFQGGIGRVLTNILTNELAA
ncbi:MAG TPA: hypothetical protein VF422_09590, partial [Dokdonella sp.]